MPTVGFSEMFKTGNFNDFLLTVDMYFGPNGQSLSIKMPVSISGLILRLSYSPSFEAQIN